jgi:hypothetical protein
MELALDSEEQRKRAQTLEQLQARDLIGHSPIKKRKGVLQQGREMAEDEVMSQAQSIGKEKLKDAYNTAADYITKSNPINTAKTKAPLSNANMQGMGGPELGAKSMNPMATVNPSQMGMGGPELGAMLSGQGAANAAMAANPATMGIGGAELGALASQGATAGAGATAAGGAMAGMATAMPYVAAGLAAAKLLGVKGFAQGGEIGPLSPLYKADGTDMPIGSLNEMTKYDQEQYKKNNPKLTKDEMPKEKPDSLAMLIARQKMREASSAESIKEKDYKNDIKGMTPDQVKRLMNNQPIVGGTGPLAQ